MQASSETRLAHAEELVADGQIDETRIFALTRDERAICQRARPPFLVESSGAEAIDSDHADGVSMLLGDWSVGSELDDRTIALEAPIDDHISTTKGCYTGQEIVARIHTYGHVNRCVVLLRCEADTALAEGAEKSTPTRIFRMTFSLVFMDLDGWMPGTWIG